MDKIHPSLRSDVTNSVTTSPALESLNASTNSQSPIYHDRGATNEPYTSGLLSASRPYAESPLNDHQQHRQSYPPLTPQSNHAGEPNSADGRSDTHAENADPKRPRACEACRGLKVKCEPDPNHPEGPCKRCTKANRNCVVTAPTRKRQKKADGRVAELEKKIDALTATIQASKAGSLGHDERNIGDFSRSNDRDINPYEQVTNGDALSSRALPEPTDWRQDMFSKVADTLPKSASSPSIIAPPMVIAGQKRKFPEFAARSPSGSQPTSQGSRTSLPNPKGSEGLNGPASNDYADVIDRGIMTAENAAKMFDRYVNDMATHVPAVVFPPGTTAAEIRKSKPILFLAILSISSSGNRSELTREVMQIFADRIICNGEKSLELIQALLITSLWYWPPEHFEELKFYQLIHIAAVMAIDIGLGKRQKAKRHRIMAGLWRDNPWRRIPVLDPESVESRRTWLACYFMCCTASMGFRRPNLMRWSPFISESIEFLYSSPDALPSDKLMCEWVKSQHIAENIGTQFSMDDPFATVQISDPKVQFALKGFERDLDHWASHVPVEIRRPTLKVCEHVINLYMHEVALHVDHNVDEFQPPFTEEKLFGTNSKESNLLSSSHISALSVCLTSIDGIFETFLSLDVDVIRTLPIFHFVRTAYAIIVLIKMYFSAASPNSELGKVIDKDHMKVEQYLDGLLEKFRSAAEDDRYRPASKFLMVLVMLKTWFQRQKEGRPGPAIKDPNKSEASSTPTHDTNDNPPQQSQNQSDYVQNTPLQLLSEVATNAGPEKQTTPAYPSSNNNNNNNNNSNSNSNTTETSDGWQAQQPYNYSTQRYLVNPPPLLPNQPSATNNQNINPNSGAAPVTWNNNYEYNQGNMSQLAPGTIDLEYTMGDGFEQALGITMGYGDLGRYFEDDQFLGGFMDTLGSSGFGLGGG